MFLEYYGLQTQPFGVTPDPRFLFNSSTHREALASLLVGIKAKRGFLALVAPPGMGKTTLLFQVMKNLEPTARTVFHFQTQCDSRQLFHYILTDMGLETDGQDVVKMHAQLNEELAANARANKQFVLIIDEAQNLSADVLETIRLLSDFETPRNKLMQIILAGQPQLAEKLACPGLVQLRQRISILARLTAFSPEETAQYIGHRLQIAGYTGPKLFSAPALELIAEYSKGIPRNINNLCFNALSWGCAINKRLFDAEILREVGAELAVNMVCQKEPSSPRPLAQIGRAIPAPRFVLASRPSSLKWIAGTTATVAMLLLGLLLAFKSQSSNSAALTGERSPASIASALPAGNLVPVAGAIKLSAPNPLQASSEESKAGGPTDNASEANDQAILVVKQAQSLSRISYRYFGRSEPRILEQIMQLNPSILNPNHIEVGQRIRLPRIRGGSQEISASHQNPSRENAKGGSDLE